MRTPEGIGLDSTVADLRRVFGEEVAIEGGIQFDPRFVVDPAGPSILSGTLSGTTETDVVTSVAGGFGCGA